MALNDLDSSQTEGTPVSPNTGSSAESGGSSGSLDAKELRDLLEAQSKRLDEIDQRSRAAQSDKDRGVIKVQKEVNDLKQKFAEVEKLKARGMSVDEAFEQIELKDSINLIKEQLLSKSAQPSTAGNGAGAVVDTAKVIAQYELDGNDPEVIAELISKNFNSPLEAENAALKLAYRRAKPTPSSVAASTAVIGESPRAASEGQLKQNYIKEIEANRGNKAGIKAVQEKYRKMGFDTGSVGFGV